MQRNELSKNSQYYLQRDRYLELYHLCRQYPTWEVELRVEPDMSKAVAYDGPKVQTSGGGDPAAELAMRRAELSQKKQIIDDTIQAVAPEIARFLLLGVCYGLPEKELETMGMPCGHNMYYDLRRKFFWTLAHKIR